jgi:ribosomal-protein-alanine N-acetyltransferase
MLNIAFIPFPELHTERLLLRQMHKEDAPAVFGLRSNEAIMRFIPRPLAQSVTDALLLIEQLNEAAAKGEAITWGIERKAQPGIIGTIGYVRMTKEHHRAEVGYLLHTAQQGQGIMREALNRVVDYGFSDMHLHSIEAVLDPANTASARVLEKSGFVKEAYFRQKELYKGAFRDIAVYSLLCTDPRK